MSDGVDLLWIPLGTGAGGAVVRASGRIYEGLAAAAARRPRCALLHSALEVHLDGRTAAVEMTPVWTKQGDRGVVVEGPVGARLLGRSRLFRYEVRLWWGGTIPDRAAAVGGPRRVTDDPDVTRCLVELIPRFPPLTWGRDEQRTGDMWNSNSLVSWLLARTGHDLSAIRPPPGSRAPGWDAGIVAAARRPPPSS
ncbi:MAG: hypothetical protein ACLGI8_02055 [Acidimicrobiia bacterium]|jgi:hypothetical protein